MRIRFAFALLILASGLALLTAAPVSARATPKCKGKTATIVLTSPQSITGTYGDDVVVGSSGNDTIDMTQGGVDLVCGGDGDDSITVTGYGSWADGGSGNDHVEAWRGATGHGGSGTDEVWGLYYDANVYGDAGDDAVYSEYGIGDGGSGNDEVRGYYALQLLGGSGKDYLFDNEGSILLDCGSNADLYDYRYSRPAEIRRCEQFGSN